MVVPMDPSDAEAVRHLLTATQKFATRAEEARQRRDAEQGQGEPRRDDRRYRYRFDDFENFDEDSDDERDFRDLSHYTTIDPRTGKVTELWLGIIDVHGVTSNNHGADDAKHWKLSESDWEWLSHLDRLEHFKLTGCGALPFRQLKELHHLKHISCSECGNISANADPEKNSDDDGDMDNVELPQIKSISLRCGFQPNPAGIESLRAMFRYINRNLTNLERITIWRLDQQLWRGHISSNTTAFQRKQYKRDLVETLLEELSSSDSMGANRKVNALELNRCGLTSEDFRRLMFEILPKNFPSLQRLSLSSNEIDELPEIQKSTSGSDFGSFTTSGVDGAPDDEPNFAKKKRLLTRLRKSLQQIHLSNNPIMEFLGKSGEESLQLPRDEGNIGEGHDQEYRQYQQDQRHKEAENAIVHRRFRRIQEFEKLRDLLRLLPKLSQLGYVSCMHNLMRSTTGDFMVTTTSSAATPRVTGDGEDQATDENHSGKRVPFYRYSKHLQRQIEYYLRVNRGGRWLIDGGGGGGGIKEGKEEAGRDDRSGHALLQSLAIWPNILEWSYRTSSSGCFLVPLPHSKEDGRSGSHLQAGQPVQTMRMLSPHPSSSLKNATALFRLLREGPALCGGGRRE